MDTAMEFNVKDAFEKARKNEESGLLKEAILGYREILENSSDFRPALVALGALFSRSGKPAQAVPLFQKALTLKVTDSILFNLGSEYFKLGELDESKKYLIRALKANPQLLRAHILLAYVYGKKKDYEKACIYFKNAIKLDARNRPARLGLVISLSESGQFDSALRALNLLGEEQVSNDPVLRNLRASLHMQTGQLKEALQSYKTLTDTSPEFKNFSDHLQAAKGMVDSEYAKMFEGIDDKIHDRSDRVKKLLQERKNGNAQPASQEDLKDLMDLSLLHLFNGDKDKALRFLFQAKKIKDEG